MGNESDKSQAMPSLKQAESGLAKTFMAAYQNLHSLVTNQNEK